MAEIPRDGHAAQGRETDLVLTALYHSLAALIVLILLAGTALNIAACRAGIVDGEICNRTGARTRDDVARLYVFAAGFPRTHAGSRMATLDVAA